MTLGERVLPSRKEWGMISDATERFQMINSPLAFHFQKGISRVVRETEES